MHLYVSFTANGMALDGELAQAQARHPGSSIETLPPPGGAAHAYRLRNKQLADETHKDGYVTAVIHVYRLGCADAMAKQLIMDRGVPEVGSWVARLAALRLSLSYYPDLIQHEWVGQYKYRQTLDSRGLILDVERFIA